MSQKINIVDLGRMDYQSAWDFQKEFHNKVLLGKEADTLFLVEHEPVYTLGKNANNNNLLKKANSNVKVFNVERGGDITYHGPGQLIGYPIINLNNYKKSISWYMRALEQVIISTLEQYDISSSRKDGMTGVWVQDDKICAMGVRLSRWVSMHGFALNIEPDMEYYDGMIPCGIQEFGITSLYELLKENIDIYEVMNTTTQNFFKIFKV